MDERIKLYVLGLSYNSLQGGAFALILAQEDGPYRIPVIIGAGEAQAIAIKMEGKIPPRPMTHDLFISFNSAFGVVMKEVFIYKFENGVFSSEIVLTDGEREVRIDSRTSDAIAIAIRTRSPIYTTPEILSEAGFILENEPVEENKPSGPGRLSREKIREPKTENLAIEELEKLLAEFTEAEKYEEAARIKRILDSKYAIRDKAAADELATAEATDWFSTILDSDADISEEPDNDDESDESDSPEKGQ